MRGNNWYEAYKKDLACTESLRPWCIRYAVCLYAAHYPGRIHNFGKHASPIGVDYLDNSSTDAASNDLQVLVVCSVFSDCGKVAIPNHVFVIVNPMQYHGTRMIKSEVSGQQADMLQHVMMGSISGPLRPRLNLPCITGCITFFNKLS